MPERRCKSIMWQGLSACGRASLRPSIPESRTHEQEAALTQDPQRDAAALLVLINRHLPYARLDPEDL